MSESNVTPLRTIQEHVGIILRKWEGLDRAGERYKSARLELALELKGLRDRIEAGEEGDENAIDWWGWYGDNFRRSRGDAEKLLTIAGSENPQAAYDAAKAKNTERDRNRRLFIVKKPEQNQRPAYIGGSDEDAVATPVKRVTFGPRRYTTGPDDDALIVQGVDVFRRLSWDGRVRFMKEVTELYKRWHEGKE